MSGLLVMTLPVWGLVLVYALAGALRGPARRMTLAVGPFVVGCAMWRLGDTIGTGGDWLAGLCWLFVYGCGYLAIGVHYVALLVGAIGMWLRRNERLRAGGDDAAPAAEPVDDGRRMAQLFGRDGGGAAG